LWKDKIWCCCSPQRHLLGRKQLLLMFSSKAFCGKTQVAAAVFKGIFCKDKDNKISCVL
jgi:hypothetical protein